MFQSLLSYLRVFSHPHQAKALWHTLWRQRDEQKALMQVKTAFPIHTATFEQVMRDLTRWHVQHRLLKRGDVGEHFWRDKTHDQQINVSVPGPIIWDGPYPQGTVYDMKFYFQQGRLIDVLLELVLHQD